MSAQPQRLRPRKFPGFTLLAAGVIWLVGTTLCSSGMIEMSHEHGVANSDEHSHSHHGSDHHHDSGTSNHQPDNDSACCGSIQSVPVQSIASSLVIVVPPSSGLFWLLDTTYAEAQLAGLFPADVDYATGPPGLDSFAEHFLQRCLLSQAPPVVT